VADTNVKSDSELLAAYAQAGDQAAFAEIVSRHAQMVYGVCLRVCANAHEAEDAAQAAFLVLISKAARLRRAGDLSAWLQDVARKSALQAVRGRARRSRREKEVAMTRGNPQGAGGDPLQNSELLGQLDAGIAALPAGQRQAIVLRYLQGLTERDAAKAAGCSVTAISTRAGKALARLRDRLARSGAQCSVASLTGILAAQSQAVVPDTFVQALLRMSELTAAGALGGGSASVQALAKGVTKMMFWAKVKTAAAMLTAATVLLGGGVTVHHLAAAEAPKPAARETGSSARVTPELPVDAKAMKIIKSLGAGQSAMLPATRMVGKWNQLTRKFGLDKYGPGRRNFSLKMVWAPDRKRALFCGANHGAPHRLNDVWEFDLAANAWILLQPPDINDGRELSNEEWVKLTEVKDGVLRSRKNKGPAMGAIGHTWWGLTYDPELKAMLWMFDSGGAGTAHILKKRTGAPVKVKLYGGPLLWSYLPEEKKWVLPTPAAPYPRFQFGAMLEYVPELKGSVYYVSGAMFWGTWLFSSETQTWKNLAPKDASGKGSSPWGEQVSCWDSANKVIVAQSVHRKTMRKKTSHYCPKANTWTRVLEVAADDQSAPKGQDWATPFYYDSVAKVCLLLEKGKGKGADFDLWAYDAAKTKWNKVSFKGPRPPLEDERRNRRALCYYDPERNVLVFNTHRKTWVYRHKLREGK
jgi:RNA polymerase sigma factor (sigma-70 family)